MKNHTKKAYTKAEILENTKRRLIAKYKRDYTLNFRFLELSEDEFKIAINDVKKMNKKQLDDAVKLSFREER